MPQSDAPKPDGSQHKPRFLQPGGSVDKDAASRLSSGTTTTPPKVRHYSPAITNICEQLFYRQSMLRDYQTCPQMMLYRWIIGHEEEDTFFAAILGTAGHRVIEDMHSTGNFAITYVELLTQFLNEFNAALHDSAVPPRLSPKFSSLTAQAQAVAPEYTSMLQGYQADRENQKFYTSFVEQSFVLPLEDEFSRKFYFTGVIDQGGFYDDGNFAIRDIKFRDSSFRPRRTEAHLDLQLTLYSLAAHKGLPACSQCKPKYTVDSAHHARPQSQSQLLGSGVLPETPTLQYTGPCDDCRSKIGTPAWPNIIPVRTELIWMRDYVPRKRDEFAKFIQSPTKEKEYNPETKRMRIKQTLNPDWIHGYKKGDPSGPGRIVTERSSAFLEVRSADILRLAGMIRDGRFFRKESSYCDTFCRHREACLSMLEMEVQDIDVQKFNENASTIDPFG